MAQDIGEQLEQVHRYVDSLDVMDPAAERYTKVNFVRAVFDNYFVYQQRELKSDGTEENTLYKQPYSMTDGALEIEGEPVEVMEQVKYRPVANEGNPIKNSEGGNEMGDKMEKKCCPEKVDALITNEATAWTEDDREWLESLNEDQIDKMETTTQVNEPEPEPEPEIDPEPTNQEVTLASYLNEAPPEIRAVLNEGMKAMDAQRKELMDKVLNHEGNSFTEKQLKDMDTEVLQGMVALIPEKKDPEPVNFVGANPQNPVVMNQEAEEEAYIPQTLADTFNSKKED